MQSQPYSRRHLLRHAALSGLALTLPRSLHADEKSKRWTVAVIGDSERGGYGHGLDTVWLEIPETKLVAVADRVPVGLNKARERLELPQEAAFSDYREMLEHSRPELVAIGPRHIDQHHDMILAALESGARGLYVEKPFCRDLIEADAIVAACADRGARLALAHRNRYHPTLPVVAQLIEDGAIGQWLEIRARGKEDARGGSLDLWVLGSHLLNLSHYLAGAPLSCQARILQDGAPLTAADLKEGAEGIGLLGGNEIHARFETERGIPLFFDSVANAGSRGAGFGLQLIGTEGIIDLRADTDPLAHYREGNPFKPTTKGTAWIPITSAGIGQPEPLTDLKKGVIGHHYPVRDLIAAVQEQRAPLCSDTDGRQILEMTMAIFASHRDGGASVNLPLADRSHPLVTLR